MDNEKDEKVNSHDLDYWLEWKEKCEVDKCDELAKRRLNAVACNKFTAVADNITKAKKWSYITNEKDPFHLFEVSSIIKINKKYNKSYKDTIFAKVDDSDDPPMKVINGQVSAMIRDIVREYLCKDYGFENVTSGEGARILVNKSISLDREVSNDEGEARTIADIKLEYAPGYRGDIDENDPANIVVQNEILSIAESMATDIMEHLTPMEIIGFAVDYLEIIHSDKELLKCISVAGSTFADVFLRKIPKRILTHIKVSDQLDEDLTILIKNINLPAEKKMTVPSPSYELICLITDINEYLRRNALNIIKERKNSETIYAGFLEYIEKHG